MRCERVAEDGVAQMADVRCLVGVDAGVLDESEAWTAEVGVLVSGNSADDFGAVKAYVEVSGSRGVKAGDARQGIFGKAGGQAGGKLDGDLSGGAAKTLCELEGKGKSKFAEGDGGWLLNGDAGKRELVLLGEKGGDAGDEGELEGSVHGSFPGCGG